MSQENSALLRVIASTDRKNRPFGLIDVAKDIDFLRQHYGSLSKVAELTGISAGMLNQFLKIDKLSDDALELVRQRKIDSVSILNSLSKFSHDEQNIIVSYILKRELNSLDIRVLLPLRSKLPKEPIDDLIKKLKDSENIKVSVIRFSKSQTLLDSNQIKDLFKRIVGDDNIISVDFEDNFGSIKLSQEGEKKLRNEAKLRKKTLNALIQNILN